MTNHDVEAWQLGHELFPTERPYLAAAGEVPAIAALTQRPEQQYVIVNVVLECNAQSGEIGIVR